MANNQINLGNLEFDQIKSSLITYLKNQTLLKDYNFNGSVINSLVDLMAYNTFYYALYTNMIANEMFLDTAQREQSIVSLTKPLGVVIPTRTSSRANIQVGGSAFIPKFTQFNGINDEGIIYNFYALQDYEQEINADNFIDNVVIVEGSELISQRNITQLVDLTKQSYFLANVNIDISTISVEVDSGDGVWKTWTLSDNIGDSTENLSQTIYFIERFDTGFELQFGKENALGNDIKSTDNVRISYLVSSGANSNGISTFSTNELPGNITIQILPNSTNYASKGGRNGPDIEYYKFIAPKFFASQNRAVTKDDFLAISAEYLRAKGYNITKDNFNVFGGEELNPPKYGRVFVTTDEVSNPDILDLVAYLKTKCTVSIMPEYVESTSDNLTYDVRIQPRNNNLTNAQREQLKLTIKNYLLANYAFYDRYNIDFSGVEDALEAAFVNDISAAYITINYRRLISPNPAPDTQKTIISLGNPINIPFGAFTTITEYTDKTGMLVRLKVFPSSVSSLNQYITFRVYDVNNGVELFNADKNYGRVNANSGIIEFEPRFSEPINIDIDLRFPTFRSSSNVKFTIAPNTIELI